MNWFIAHFAALQTLPSRTQHAASAGETRHYGPDRNIDRLRNLPIGEILDVSEYDDLTELHRQFFQQGANALRILPAHNSAFRRLVLLLPKWNAVIDSIPFRLHRHHVRAAGVWRPANVPENCHQPGLDVGSAQTVKMAKCTQVALLYGV